MPETKLYVRYMISLRCVMLVKKLLENFSIPFTHVESGTIVLPHAISEAQFAELSRNLRAHGFGLLDRTTCSLIDQITDIIVDIVHYSEAVAMENSVQIISQKLGQDPDYLATIFAEVKGFTLIQFVDSHRIEKIKELLLYDQLSLELIAERLNYASVAELRGHFKKATGLAPSFFYELGKKRRALFHTV